MVRCKAVPMSRSRNLSQPCIQPQHIRTNAHSRAMATFLISLRAFRASGLDSSTTNMPWAAADHALIRRLVCVLAAHLVRGACALSLHPVATCDFPSSCLRGTDAFGKEPRSLRANWAPVPQVVTEGDCAGIGRVQMAARVSPTSISASALWLLAFSRTAS